MSPALWRWMAPSLCVALVACSGGKGGDGTLKGKGPTGDDDDDSTVDEQLFVEQGEMVAGDTGIVLVDVEVEPGDASFQVTGEVGSHGRISVIEITDPSGRQVTHWEDWWDSSQSLMDGFFGYGPTTAVQWPVRDVDGELTPGTWQVRLQAHRPNYQPLAGEPVEVTTMVKADDDLANGDVVVQIVWADGVDGDPEVKSNVEAAVERWREVWALYGLNLSESYVQSSLDPGLDFFDAGSDEVAALPKEGRALRLIVGDKVGNDNFTYGISAGIPGSATDTRHTYVVVSWLVHAGQDGVFNADETRLMGETMAHEVGHYMGLYHPVESSYTYWDALDDTVECRNATQCEEQLGTNLMFPYSICNGQGCVVTDQMSPGQVAVKQRYVSAR
jgi:hypothetical protein